MIDAFVTGFLAGILAYLVLSGFQELRLWRLSVAVRDLRNAMLSDTRRAAATKRWDTNKELEELISHTRMNKNGVNVLEELPDKWGDWLSKKN